MLNKKIAFSFIVLAVAVTASAAVAGGRPMATALSGSAEVPGPGDPDASGMAWLRFNPGQEKVCVRFEVSGIAPATAAHVHEAAAGAAGPVVVPLPTPNAEGLADGCVELSRQEIKEIMKNPEAYYVNVHNAEYPAGALRGQLSR